MANSFSLLRLPNEERLQVLRCMDGRSLLLLSLISPKSKDLVKSVLIKPSRFHVRIGADVCLHMPNWGFCLRFYKERQDNMKMLVKPNKVWTSVDEINGGRTQYPEMEIPNHLEIREWYHHILYILNA